MLVLEHRLGEPLEKVLNRLYHERGLTQDQIGEELGVDGSTVARWMDRLDIEARFPGPRAGVV
jgi:DNA-binding MarR family transcriptional regulator